MKNILLYIALLIGVVYLGSCNLNDYPTFDDKDAFVAFTAERYSVKEDTGTFKVPVRLTSLNPQSTTVSFEVIDGTAIAGRDYNISAGASVVNFDGNDPVNHLEIDIIEHEGVFTGDLQFSVVISNAGNVNIGGNDTTIVVIQDLDHPLAAILGDYVGSGNDAWDDDEYSWSNVSFDKDPSDVTKVWIVNVFSGYASTIEIYGIVNEDMTEISIPVHQSVGVVSGYNAYFEAAEPDPFKTLAEGEKITLSIDGNIISVKGDYEVGIGAYNATSGAFAGWFERVYNLKFTKK